MKRKIKYILSWMLGRRVLALRKNNPNLKVVAVVGSIGKTSTKSAIATILSEKYRVLYQKGNYNDWLTVPLIFFNMTLPPLKSLTAWINTLKIMSKEARVAYPYDIVVVELGTDTHGDIAGFKSYIHADIAVITGIAPEHMEYFKTIDGVASEECAVLEFSDKVVVNVADFPSELYKKEIGERKVVSYGTTDSNYYADIPEVTTQGTQATLRTPEGSAVITLKVVGEHSVKPLLAAMAVGQLLGLSPDELMRGLTNITPFPGRMQILKGIKNSVIIDDTYNSSPIAVEAALATLYDLEAKQKIAILGSMNELGEESPPEHTQIGQLCDPEELDLVVTIGKDANDYLAPPAEARGCVVKQFTNPHVAGVWVAAYVEEGAIILVKGSQNGVFAEEAIKPLLSNKADEQKLVRQSDHWMHVKHQQFGIQKD